MTSPYLENIRLDRTLPCLAEPGKLIIVGTPDRDLREVIPYLAALPGIIGFNPEAHSLSFRRQTGFLTLFAEKVCITQVKDLDEGLALLDALKDSINVTWEKRSELKPLREKRNIPRPLDVWKLLPQTNCRLCGEATCMAFAVALLLNRQSLKACVPLNTGTSDPEYLAALKAMIEG